MVKAGLPILQVLAMLRDQMENPGIKDIIEDIRKSLEGGLNLSRLKVRYRARKYDLNYKRQT